MTDEQLFKRLSELEEAYVAGHITMQMYINEYNKIVDVRKREEQTGDELGAGRKK